MPFSGLSRRTTRVFAGLAFWAGLVIGLIVVCERTPEAKTAVGRVAQHLVAVTPPVFETTFPKWAWVKPGHAVRIASGDTYLVAGEVRTADEVGEELRVTLSIYPEFASTLRAGARLEAVSSSGDMSWIVATLLPPAKMKEIKAILATSWNAEKEKFWKDLEPGATRLVGEVAQILRDDMPRLVESRKTDFQTLGEVLRTRAWDAHLEEVFITDIWPAAENRSLPLLTKIADEVAQRAPVWSLSWSYVRGRLPWGDDEALRKKVRDFIDAEVIPIVKRHRDDFKDGAVLLITDTLKEERVLRALKSAFAEVLADERFRGALKSIIETWMVDNERLTTLLKTAYERPDIRRPIEAFFDAREGDINDIANLIIMDPVTKGISPDLARVLRRKILGESRSWLLLTPGEGAALSGKRIPGVMGGEK